MRKDSCKRNPIGEKGIDPKRPYFPRDDRNRSQGKNFQGICLQSQAGISGNFGTPVIKGNKGI